MYPHRIRLRGPWRLEPVAGDQPPRTARLPGRWADAGLAGFRGTVRYRRSFGMPRRLDPWERVFITCDGAAGHATVFLNGERLGEFANGEHPFSIEATGKLVDRNELVIDLTADERGGIWGDVALEIRASVWLENVEFQWFDGETEPRLAVRGGIAGRIEDDVDAFVIVGRGVVFQTTIRPGDVGRHFEWTAVIPSETVEAEHVLAAVELVHGSAIWYRIEERIPTASSRRGTTS